MERIARWHEHCILCPGQVELVRRKGGKIVLQSSVFQLVFIAIFCVVLFRLDYSRWKRIFRQNARFNTVVYFIFQWYEIIPKIILLYSSIVVKTNTCWISSNKITNAPQNPSEVTDWRTIGVLPTHYLSSVHHWPSITWAHSYRSLSKTLICLVTHTGAQTTQQLITSVIQAVELLWMGWLVSG